MVFVWGGSGHSYVCVCVWMKLLHLHGFGPRLARMHRAALNTTFTSLHFFLCVFISS
jgi:hypothetical protein